jgi:hypothetical protein
MVNTRYEIDVALESTATNGADYRARESGAATAPQLVIVVQ